MRVLGPPLQRQDPPGPLLNRDLVHPTLHPGHPDPGHQCLPRPSRSEQPLLPGTGDSNRLLQDVPLPRGEAGIPQCHYDHLLQRKGSGYGVRKHGLRGGSLWLEVFLGVLTHLDSPIVLEAFCILRCGLWSRQMVQAPSRAYLCLDPSHL